MATSIPLSLFSDSLLDVYLMPPPVHKRVKTNVGLQIVGIVEHNNWRARQQQNTVFIAKFASSCRGDRID